MSAPILIVEARLRVVLVYLDALRQLALLVDEPVLVPQFDTPQEFAKWVAGMAQATAAQVAAVRAVLPATCTSLDAPLIGGAHDIGIAEELAQDALVTAIDLSPLASGATSKRRRLTRVQAGNSEAHAAPLQSCKYRWLHAPATVTIRSPVSRPRCVLGGSVR